MKKILNIILIICSFGLIAFLGLNIYNYNELTKEKENIIKDSEKQQKNISEKNKKKEELSKTLSSLKDTNKDKIEENNKWVKWNQEIVDLMD